MLNKFELMGRLTKDVEVKSVNEKTVINFTLAVARNFVGENNERKTDFISLSAWNQSEKFVKKYLKQGKIIVVGGRIQTDNYEKDGVKHYKTDLIVEEIHPTDFEKNEESTNEVIAE